MPRLGLHMIVKDEAPVIGRCLQTLRPHIAWWVISDTGSSDGTQEIVRRTMEGVPGVLLERPWVSFGHNRQEALDAARTLPQSRPEDYLLWIDADDELHDVPERWPELTEDGYRLDVEYGDVRFERLHLTRLGAEWQWVGAVHEHLDLPGATTGHLVSPRIVQHHDGARSRDADVYRKDALLLEAELRRRPDDPRTEFYLAQSWRDAGELVKALAAYRVRAANRSGWEEERWYALFQVAVCSERLGRPSAEVADAYLAAYDVGPHRAEPLVELARLERGRERFEAAVLYARAATTVADPPRSALFVDRGAYEWRRHDELSISCYWTGRYEEGRRAALQALAARPEDERLKANLAWCESKLAAAEN